MTDCTVWVNSSAVKLSNLNLPEKCELIKRKDVPKMLNEMARAPLNNRDMMSTNKSKSCLCRVKLNF